MHKLLQQSFPQGLHKIASPLHNARAPYTMQEADTLEAFYNDLDSHTSMFTRMENPTPTMLKEAYTKEIEIGKQLGQQGMGH